MDALGVLIDLSATDEQVEAAFQAATEAERFLAARAINDRLEATLRRRAWLRERRGEMLEENEDLRALVEQAALDGEPDWPF